MIFMDMKNVITSCFQVLKIEFDMFGFTVSLWQIFLFGTILYILVNMIFELLLD